MAKPQMMDITKLTVDYTLYPRHLVSSVVVNQYAAAMEAGSEFPALRVEAETLRIIDGVHRYEAYRKYGIGQVPVVIEKMESDRQFFEEAVRANNSHGRAYAPFDQKRVILRAEELGMEPVAIGDMLRLPVHRIEEMRKGFAFGPSGEQVPLKGDMKHLAGAELTAEQIETNKKAGGMGQRYYVQLLLNWITSDSIDWGNAVLVEKLGELRVALDVALTDRAA